MNGTAVSVHRPLLDRMQSTQEGSPTRQQGEASQRGGDDPKQRRKCYKKSEDDTAEPGGSLAFGDSNDDRRLYDHDCDFWAEPLHETKCHGSRRGRKEDGPKLELERRRGFVSGHVVIVATLLDQGQVSSSILKQGSIREDQPREQEQEGDSENRSDQEPNQGQPSLLFGKYGDDRRKWASGGLKWMASRIARWPRERTSHGGKI